MNHYPHHIGDFNNATRHLTRVERSLYRDLLDLYYDKEAPLPRDTDRLARLVLASSAEERDALSAVLSEFFEEHDDGWHNARCDREIAAYRDKIEAASRAGKASAERRYGARQTTQQQGCIDGITVVQQPLSDRVTNQNQNQNQHVSPDGDTSRVSRSGTYPPEFEEAWQAYPQRPGASKKDAHKAWAARIKAGADHTVILQGVIRYAEFCRASGTEPRYIKQPTTFFGPGEHYLADWSARNTGNQQGGTIHDKRAATIAALTGNSGGRGATIDSTAERLD